jgi:hypothetical protein
VLLSLLQVYPHPGAAVITQTDDCVPQVQSSPSSKRTRRPEGQGGRGGGKEGKLRPFSAGKGGNRRIGEGECEAVGLRRPSLSRSQAQRWPVKGKILFLALASIPRNGGSSPASEAP